MIMAIIHLGDGLSSGRIWLKSVVKNLQRGLTEGGFPLEPDGKFGSDTLIAVKAFQNSNGLPETGDVDRNTWEVLLPYLERVLGPHRKIISELLDSFRGDLGWIHEREAHSGRPYWPEGSSASGVTLDPGVDLGHAEIALIDQLYQPLVTPEQYTAIKQVMGLRGEAARNALIENTTLLSIRISEEQAENLMPYTAQPYWDGIAGRFSSLKRQETLPSVQTVLLSLAYNRGFNNSDLQQLEAPLDAGAWADVSNRINAMQQDHELEGIKVRRQMEAKLIQAELEYLES